MVEHLGQQLRGLLEELRTVADPEAAELQIEAVTSQAAEQVATAAARPAGLSKRKGAPRLSARRLTPLLRRPLH